MNKCVKLLAKKNLWETIWTNMLLWLSSFRTTMTQWWKKKYLLFYQVSTTKHFRQIQAFRDCGSLYDAATFRTYRQFSSSSHKETDFIQIAVFQTFVYLIEQILFQLLQTTVHLENTCERNTIRSKHVIKYHEKVHLVQFRQYQLQRVGRVK